MGTPQLYGVGMRLIEFVIDEDGASSVCFFRVPPGREKELRGRTATSAQKYLHFVVSYRPCLTIGMDGN